MTAFGRLDGRPVGCLANQALVAGGTIDAAACEKGARFIATCDAFGLPAGSLIDVPGLLIGRRPRAACWAVAAPAKYELGHGEVARAGGAAQGYGLGYYAMAGGRSSTPMPASHGPRRGARDVVEARWTWPAQGLRVRAGCRRTRRQEIIDEIRARIARCRPAEGFGVDDLINRAPRAPPDRGAAPRPTAGTWACRRSSVRSRPSDSGRPAMDQNLEQPAGRPTFRRVRRHQPAPFCAGLLAGLRRRGDPHGPHDAAGRQPGGSRAGRRWIALNLKDPAAISACLALLKCADGLLEGFRPGVMERLGLGPDGAGAQRQDRLRPHDRLGPDQPLAQAAGPRHQLHLAQRCARRDRRAGAAGGAAEPGGRLGGGSMCLAFGLRSRRPRAGARRKGQVVDCSMVEGSASLLTGGVRIARRGRHGRPARQQRSRRCSAVLRPVSLRRSGKWMSVGWIEPFSRCCWTAWPRRRGDQARENDH